LRGFFLETNMRFKTPDLCDQFESELGQSVRVVAPMFQRYGGRTAFCGEIVTLKLFEDNSLVRTALGEGGKGKVLVVDGGASLRCALVGDQLAILAQSNGWEGIVVYGCIRDSGDIAGIDIGVRALATHPQKSVKKGVGDRNVAVTFGGVTFTPGQYLYADEDGIVVSTMPLA
jgi:regulator of ribonuclease activity A